MAAALGLLQLVLLAMGCFAVGLALLTALIYPHVCRHLATLTPPQHARVLRWLCAVPLGGAALLTGLCLAPSVLGAIWPEVDHCLTHHGHVHICLVHPPSSLGGALGWGANGLFWGLVATGLVAVVRRAVATAHAVRALRLSARFEPAVGAHVITSSLPFSAVAGFLQQKIVLSTALADALPAPLLRIVLAHEAAHVRRRDSFWQLISTLLSVAHLPALRHQLLSDLALAAERSCDEHAARVVGDRLGVASAILFVERMLADRVGMLPLAPGFGGSDVPARVEALLEPPGQHRAWLMATIGVALIAAAPSLVQSGSLHHWTETLLGFLVR
ncbi:MAG: M56 family metallopeptidase [Candidatus Binatia bacterium]